MKKSSFRTFSFNGVERACQEGGGVVREAQRGAGQDQRVAQHQQVSSTLSLSLSLLLTMVTQTAPVGAKNSPPSSSRIHHDWLQHFHWQFFSPAIHTTLLGFGNMKVLKLNLEVRLVKSWRYGWISRLLQYFFLWIYISHLWYKIDVTGGAKRPHWNGGESVQVKQV